MIKSLGLNDDLNTPPKPVVDPQSFPDRSVPISKVIGVGNYTFPNQTSTIVGAETGTAAPTETPVAVGQLFIDTTNTKIYISVGSASSADWKQVYP